MRFCLLFSLFFDFSKSQGCSKEEDFECFASTISELDEIQLKNGRLTSGRNKPTQYWKEKAFVDGGEKVIIPFMFSKYFPEDLIERYRNWISVLGNKDLGCVRFHEVPREQMTLYRAPFENGIVIAYNVNYYTVQCFSSIGVQAGFLEPELYGAYANWQLLSIEMAFNYCCRFRLIMFIVLNIYIIIEKQLLTYQTHFN
jgi:hypothetical protein